jgi:hypothetical protein
MLQPQGISTIAPFLDAGGTRNQRIANKAVLPNDSLCTMAFESQMSLNNAAVADLEDTAAGRIRRFR